MLGGGQPFGVPNTLPAANATQVAIADVDLPRQFEYKKLPRRLHSSTIVTINLSEPLIWVCNRRYPYPFSLLSSAFLGSTLFASTLPSERSTACMVTLQRLGFGQTRFTLGGRSLIALNLKHIADKQECFAHFYALPPGKEQERQPLKLK